MSAVAASPLAGSHSGARRRQIAVPSLLEIAPDIIDAAGSLLADNGFDLGHTLVVSGARASAAHAQRIVDDLQGGGRQVTLVTNPDGTLRAAAQLAARIIEEEVTLGVAVGGGRVIDTVKLAAARTGTEFVACPTTIAHDGMSSPVASLRRDGGGRGSFAAVMPAGVLVDLSVIATSPMDTVRAGVGDLLSNLTAGLDWRLADRAGADRFDAFSAMIAENAARTVLRFGDLELQRLYEPLAHGLLLSGLAMASAGTSRPCSGAEHLISHSLDEMFPRKPPGIHGEQVALGSLMAAAAHGSELTEELKVLYAQVGLPRHPGDLGLTMDEFLCAVRAAPATRPGRYTILSQIDLCSDLDGIAERAFG